MNYTKRELKVELNLIMASLGPRIRQYRRKKGLTAKELADKVGVSDRSITAYERGDKVPSLRTLIAIAFVLEEPLDDIVGI